MSAKGRIAAEDAADGDHEAYGEIQDSLPVQTQARFAVRDLREAVTAEVSQGQAGRTIFSAKGRRGFGPHGTASCRTDSTSPCRLKWRWRSDSRPSPTTSPT